MSTDIEEKNTQIRVCSFVCFNCSVYTHETGPGSRVGSRAAGRADPVGAVGGSLASQPRSGPRGKRGRGQPRRAKCLSRENFKKEIICIFSLKGY